MGSVAAYDMYKEYCDGLLDATWKVDVKDRMLYSEFHMKLSKQMLEYDPKHNLYNGDDRGNCHELPCSFYEPVILKNY